MAMQETIMNRHASIANNKNGNHNRGSLASDVNQHDMILSMDETIVHYMV